LAQQVQLSQRLEDLDPTRDRQGRLSFLRAGQRCRRRGDLAAACGARERL